MTPDATTAAFRFGFGLPLPDAAPTEAEAMLALLGGPDVAAGRWPGVTTAKAAAVMREVTESRASKDPADADANRLKTAKRAVNALMATGARVTFARAIGSGDGLRERLVRFWANHFAVVAKAFRHKGFPSAMVEEAIRPNLTGRFADMLTAVTLHPAMLHFLDQIKSTGPNSPEGIKRGSGLNENLAREVIELHTMGVASGYAQADITELAKLLTGLSVDRSGLYAFQPGLVEPGAETVFGVAYDGKGDAPVRAVLEDLAMRPETARFIARKLAVHFVADEPDAALVAALAAEFEATGGDLMAVYAVLLRHPAAWNPATQKARQPDEFLLAALRGLGFGAEEMLSFADAPFQRMILAPLAAMGRPWQMPLGPDGFAEAAAVWITPQGLAERIDWAMEVPGRLVPTLPEAPVFAETVLGARADAGVMRAVQRSENLREAVGLVLASPQFNRR